MFFPVFISGHSGNGKTFMVEQVCAKVKRPMIRVQMSRETDEDDLIGGFRLIDGETKFMKGPVLRAMELGALLLIDEADRADPGKAMCLQGILEGKPYYMKKTGEIVHATHGFNVIVTANTKGRGSDDGRYVAATMLDDAWLERFPITIEQEYPTAAIEKRILTNYLSDDTITEDDKAFIEHLVVWSEIIRKTFTEGAIDELISTRRLVHIAHTFRMIGDRMKAIRLCINRFDEETKTAFLDLYAKVDPTINPVTETPAAETTQAAENTQEVSF
jgi:MoxR-like ATPase